MQPTRLCKMATSRTFLTPYFKIRVRVQKGLGTGIQDTSSVHTVDGHFKKVQNIPAQVAPGVPGKILKKKKKEEIG